VRALLRRSSGEGSRQRLRIGQLDVERPSAGALAGALVALSPREFAVLDVLVSRAGSW